MLSWTSLAVTWTAYSEGSQLPSYETEIRETYMETDLLRPANGHMTELESGSSSTQACR